MTHAFLALSCLALLAVIAFQDYAVPALRNKTISAGLTGPEHALLDAAYLPLAIALCVSFHGWMELFAVISAVALILVATTNTAHVFVDRITGGKHALWHSRFTLVVFIAALALQVVGDHGWLWVLTAANVAVPAACYFYFHVTGTDIDGTIVQASPAAEKCYVAFLCLWLIVWASGLP